MDYFYASLYVESQTLCKEIVTIKIETRREK